MTASRSNLAVLTDAERCRVLQRLLDAHPEVSDDAERLAIDVLGELDRSTVAAQVRDALESVSTGDVAAISGKQRGWYVEPHEAIGMLLEAAGHRDVATEIGNGILDGLDQANGDDQAAISFDEQFTELFADHVIFEMERAGLPVDEA